MAKRKRGQSFLFERTSRKHKIWWVPTGTYGDPRQLSRSASKDREAEEINEQVKLPKEGNEDV